MTVGTILSLSLLWCMLFVYCQNSVFSQPTCSEPRPSYCNSERLGDSNRPCTLSTSVSIDCSYSVLDVNNMSQVPTVPPCSIDIPGKAGYANWSIFYFHGPKAADSYCYPGLNLTWRLPSDGSVKFLTGFLLNLTYLHNGRTISRRFDIGAINYQQNFDRLYKTVFYYDCFQLFVGQSFRIALQSLPMSRPGRRDSNNVIIVGNLPGADEHTDCNDNLTKSWQARAIVSPSDMDSLIEVIFDAAPDCYNYKGYKISLVRFYSGAMMAVSLQQTAYPRFGEPIHVVFKNVCPDIYRLMIVPFVNNTCQCLVHDVYSTPPNAVICQPCAETDISPIYMNRSKCLPDVDDDNSECPTDSTTTKAPTISASDSTTTKAPIVGATGQIIGAVVGSCVALVLLVLLLGFITRWCRRLPEEPYKVQRKQKIVLASLGCSKTLENVLASFAKFLESRIHCVVVSDELCASSPPSGNSSQLADRFHGLLRDADHLILVHFERSSRMSPQPSANNNSNKNNNNNNSKTTPTDYVSVIAVLLADCMSRMPRRCAVYNVFFKPSLPCCVSESVQSLCGGRVYELMDDINLLLVHIDGPTDVRADNYTQSSEGDKLSSDIKAFKALCNRDSGTFSRSSSDSSLSRMSMDPSFPPLAHDGMSRSSPDLESTLLQVNKIESFLRAMNNDYDHSCGLDVASNYAISAFRNPGELLRNDSGRSWTGTNASVA